MKASDLHLLAEPFPVGELQWRLMRAGKNDRGIWAICIPYVDSRSIMKRLDDVAGPANWQSATQTSHGHVAAGIGIRIDGEWVWRWDGTGQLETNPKLSAADAGKGDFSMAFKRVAVQWAISRYLYDVPELFAVINSNGRFRGQIKEPKESFTWDPPKLPASALPSRVPPIVADVRQLLEAAGRLGLGAENDSDAAGVKALEAAIETHDTRSLERGKPWLAGEIAKRKAEAENARKQLGTSPQRATAGADQGSLPY